VLAACRTGLRCVSARLCAAPPAAAARSGAARAARRGWIGGCHRRDCLQWSRPSSQRTRAALLILPRAADRRCSGRAWWHQAARALRISCTTCSCAGAPWHHLQDRGASAAALDRPAARRRDVLAGAGGEARSQVADGADGRRHGPRLGSSIAALRVGGAAGGSGIGSSGGDGHIIYDLQAHTISSDIRCVGCGAASAMSSTGPATRLALNARDWVWAWCGCLSPQQSCSQQRRQRRRRRRRRWQWPQQQQQQQ
jgi:hypothetical protein